MFPLAVDGRESPDLRGIPAVLGRLGVADDDVALLLAFALFQPVLLKEVVRDFGDFLEPGKSTKESAYTTPCD